MIFNMKDLRVDHIPKNNTDKTVVFLGDRYCGEIIWWKHVRALSATRYEPVLPSGEKLQSGTDLQATILNLVQTAMTRDEVVTPVAKPTQGVAHRFAAVRSQEKTT